MKMAAPWRCCESREIAGPECHYRCPDHRNDNVRCIAKRHGAPRHEHGEAHATQKGLADFPLATTQYLLVICATNLSVAMGSHSEFQLLEEIRLKPPNQFRDLAATSATSGGGWKNEWRRFASIGFKWVDNQPSGHARSASGRVNSRPARNAHSVRGGYP